MESTNTVQYDLKLCMNNSKHKNFLEELHMNRPENIEPQMYEPVQEEWKYLHEQVKQLEEENLLLKRLLDEAGISYQQIQALEKISSETYDLNQGGRIQSVRITDDLANRFFARFWGRQDVYSKRSVKKGSGEIGYYPQCDNFWSYGCPRKSGKKVKCMDCSNRNWTRLEIAKIKEHLEGKAADASDVIGVYPLLTDETCRFLVFDFDNHEKDAEKNDFANLDDRWKEEVNAMREICRQNSIEALVERSRSGRGAHIWIFFQKPISASLARKFGFALLDKGAESVNLKSFRYYDRMLPAQDHIPDGGVGNLIALPLQGQALKDGNSAFIDDNWNAYPNQWSELFQISRLSEECVEARIKEWQAFTPFDQEETDGSSNAAERVKPWERNAEFLAEDVNGKLHLILSNHIYIEISNLKPRIQNQIRKLAAFKNPAFYKNQAIGLSNFSNSRYIYLGQDEDNYIGIPRGLYDKLIEKCNAAGIFYETTDMREQGKLINVKFNGELRESQKPAVQKLLENEIGILSAATAFGKTVVCSNMIAERKVNTLILLESSSLIDQWQEALHNFLVINEAPPEYQTPTGQTKKRKSVVGKLQGAHDSLTGIIDIAMVGSLCKKGELHPKLQSYGMVILDECHHAASDTISNILKEVKAKYVYGVTATPIRGDGLEKINEMMLGPIRYRFTAKDKANEQGIPHLVYPRFTRTINPQRHNEKTHVNYEYAIIRDNVMRNEQIIEDVEHCVRNGRTPVILSRYTSHAQMLYERVKEYADKTFLLLGGKGKREQRKIREQMNKLSPDESLILVATGQLIGEGFDYPRLDTLIMATPVAGKGIVEQYAGRLNRDYEGKENVIIYDYVDSHIPVFDRMYSKRLRAYKQIGYEICTDGIQAKQEANAIFDIDNYRAVYEQDLLEANKEIVISSPRINSDKVNQIISLLQKKQESGLQVTILTWHPDAYKYGHSEFRMNLMEQLRRTGFCVQLAEEHCEHYAIIDKEIVWYGSVNLLSKEDTLDNLMRVRSRDIAAELLEMTFGKNRELEQW